MSKRGYPIWWDTTITIYNKFEDPQTHIVTWFRKVLSDCFWKASGDTVMIGQISVDTKAILCRIPKDSSFMERFEWEHLPNDQMGDYVTLGLGDILVKGEVLDEIDEYTAGQRSTDLLSKYRTSQRCMEVEEFAVNTGLGRNNEHYLVRGK